MLRKKNAQTKTPTGTTSPTTTTTVPSTTVAAPGTKTPRQSNKWKTNNNSMGPFTPAQEQARQFGNLAKLYKQTFPVNIDNMVRRVQNADSPDVMTAGVDAIQQLQRRKDNSLPILRKLTNFAGAQGFAPEDTQQALQTYLQQEQALSQFMPRHYRAPNKQDLLGAVNNYAPQYQQKREQEQQINDMIPYIAMIRDSMLATADSDYQYMQDKASTIKDPEKQAQALATADNIYRLKLMYADSIASNPASNDPSSLMSILGAANAGQTKNINNLYGGAGNTPEAQAGSGSSQAIDENFIAQILGEQ